MVGPIIADISGCSLSPEDKDILSHPLVSGVILFTRNYESLDQLKSLTTSIHALKEKPMPIFVDQEGGRIQRFLDDFSPLPAAGFIGDVYNEDPDRALTLAYQAGLLMATELKAAGVDISFAPMVDIRRDENPVLKDRCFHQDPGVIGGLAGNVMEGMRKLGMPACAKHFPGHGGVIEDSHVAIPKDIRTLAQLKQRDLIPFQQMINQGVDAIMMAHVIYPDIDPLPACFSERWIKIILREKMSFKGLVYSDDLSMKGAEHIGDMVQRARTALKAGCNRILICNDRSGLVKVLDSDMQSHAL